MNSEILAAAKAKQRHAPTKETPKQSLPLLCPDSASYQKQMRETYLEEYFELIKPYSFASLFHVFNVPEIEALIKAHAQWKVDKKKRAWSLNPVLVSLAAAVDKLQAELKTEHIFVRLSSRSPKDAALSSDRLRELYQEAIKRLEAEPAPPGAAPSTPESRQLHALYISSTQNGNEAIDLLVESDRIQEDLKEAIPSSIPFQLIVRQFQMFDVQHEFRGFVYGKKVTALTQYNEFCYFPALQALKPRVQADLLAFFEKHLLPVVLLQNYVVDLLWRPEADRTFEAYVIELNPMAEFAGSGLFKWEEPEDNAILRGLRPFEFRIAEKPTADNKHLISNTWARALLQPDLNS